MALRILARAAPLLLGAVAAATWLRSRRPERPALPMSTGPVDRSTDRLERAPVDIVTVVDDLLGAPR
jgi:hypothetical protein